MVIIESIPFHFEQCTFNFLLHVPWCLSSLVWSPFTVPPSSTHRLCFHLFWHVGSHRIVQLDSLIALTLSFHLSGWFFRLQCHVFSTVFLVIFDKAICICFLLDEVTAARVGTSRYCIRKTLTTDILVRSVIIALGAPSFFYQSSWGPDMWFVTTRCPILRTNVPRHRLQVRSRFQSS